MDNPAPTALWVWIMSTGLAGVVMLAGWRGARWWRGASALAVPLSVLCAAFTLDGWVGYFPTVRIGPDDRRSAARPDRRRCSRRASKDPHRTGKPL